ncbi:dihydroorotase, partial [Pseudomonas aeruginosa]
TLVPKTRLRVAELGATPDRVYHRDGYWPDLVLDSELEHPGPARALPLNWPCNLRPFPHRAIHETTENPNHTPLQAWDAG